MDSIKAHFVNIANAASGYAVESSNHVIKANGLSNTRGGLSLKKGKT